MEKNSITLTRDQENAKDKICDWWLNRRHEKQCFILTGYAGTGKSFLLNYTIENELELNEKEVQFVAPTGKAATVLIQKGAINASTIHKLIYNIIEEEFTTEVNGEKITSKKQKFVKVRSLPSRIKLIVLDETSMVDEKVMKDLLSFGVSMICCGDDAQLPPVGKSTDMLKNPDATLNEIVRQQEDNAIIKIATMARNKENIPSGNYGDVIVVNRNSLTEETYNKLLVEADQVLCGTNRMRAKMNHHIKKLKGLNPYAINMNEKVICLLNNWEQTLDTDGEYFLVNRCDRERY